MKDGFSVKYLKALKLLVFVILVSCQRSCCNPHVAAFIASKFRCTWNTPTIVENYRYTLFQSCKYSTKLQIDRLSEESDPTDCTLFPSQHTIPQTNRRRELFRETQKQVSSLILASLILGEKAVYAQQENVIEPSKTKTILITGANSGIGFEACKRLIAKGHTIILACRSIDKAQDAIQRIQQDDTILKNGKLVPAECDLADLSSIRKFVTNLGPDTKIDTLCLNAGVARNTAATDCERTKDGFELTGEFCRCLYWIEKVMIV